jgi:pyrroloquinoline-quinone synthase
VRDFWTELEGARARWNVLEHPFYQRWSEGSLADEELARYSGEYRHAVVALAQAADGAARSADGDLRAQLGDHAAEERSHVALWDGFVRAVGGDAELAPAPETRECAATWAGGEDRSLLETLVAMYAIESGQPAISETKLAGLREHYGVARGEGTAYFELHATLDHEHAAAERELIEERLDGADLDALLAEAEAVLRANWKLLDGVSPA